MTADKSRRPFGLFSVICLIVANMIGAGVFTTSGFSMVSLERWAIMLAWVVAGGIALCGAISYGLLARRITESGGEYLFLSRSIHPAVGFVAGWVSLLQGFTGAIAFAAVTLEAYALPESIQPDWYVAGSLPIASILLFTCLHSLVLKFGVASQNLVVALKLFLLALFLLLAFVWLPLGHWQGFSHSEDPKTFSILAFATALVYISLSYSGFNAAVYVTEEVENAKRNVPKAMFLGTLFVMLFYLGLNYVFLYGPTPNSITGEKQVATIASQAIGGPWFAQAVRAIICLALLSSVSSMIVAGPRVYSKMASDGVFPNLFRATTVGSNKVPTFSIWFQAILACVVVMVASLQDLLGSLSFTLSVSAALTASCLFWKGKSPDSPSRTSTTRFSPIMVVPIIYVIATLSLAVLFVWSSMSSVELAEDASPIQTLFAYVPKPLIAFVMTIVSGLFLYFCFRNTRKT